MQLHQAGHVEDVLQHLAHRLEDDREAAVLRRDRQQLADRWRCCHSGRAAASGLRRGSSSARAGALAEARGEQRRAADLRLHGRLDVLRREDRDRAVRRLLGLRQAQHDAVVGVHRLHVHAVGLAQPRQRQRPRLVHLAPNGEWMASRQSPSSSRKRSTRMVRSSGRVPVASRCSAR
jgi:hypothetical protein